MERRDRHADGGQGKAIAPYSCVAPEAGHGEQDREREHEGALMPAQAAGSLADDLADEERGQAR